LQLRREAGEHPNPIYFSTSRIVFFNFIHSVLKIGEKGKKKVFEGKGKIFEKEKR